MIVEVPLLRDFFYGKTFRLVSYRQTGFMKEDILQYIWRQKLIPLKNLRTVDDESIQILHPGNFNTDGGPDFLEAKIRIGETILAGSIEIHVRSSDWKAHRHSLDQKYSNVILHVVYFHDEKESLLPVLEMNGKIPPLVLQKYRALMESTSQLPCEPFWNDVDTIIWKSFKERLVVERLERKSEMILYLLNQKNNDWLQVIYQLLGKYFGGKVNRFAFEMLMEKLDYKILLKHADDHFQLEALLFGVAGLLHDPQDEHTMRLQQEFAYFQQKYHLVALPVHYWNFLRIRPASFPTIRLALFADLIYRTPQFSRLTDFKKAQLILQQLCASAYWDEHYVFGKPVEKMVKRLGVSSVDMLLINVCIPLQYAYAKNMQQPGVMEEAMELLETLRGEQNARTKIFQGLLPAERSAYDSQAMLELYDRYCTSKKCLQCRIGHKIVQANVRLKE